MPPREHTSDRLPAGAPARLLVVAHGRSTWNEQRRITGRSDPPLAPSGHRQARDLADLVADWQLDAVYSSPLLRSLESARPAAARHGLGIRTLPELHELCFGALEGRPRDGSDPEARRSLERWKADPSSVTSDGGESFDDLVVRVVAALARIFGDGHSRTSAVTRESALRLILCLMGTFGLLTISTGQD